MTRMDQPYAHIDERFKLTSEPDSSTGKPVRFGGPRTWPKSHELIGYGSAHLKNLLKGDSQGLNELPAGSAFPSQRRGYSSRQSSHVWLSPATGAEQSCANCRRTIACMRKPV